MKTLKKAMLIMLAMMMLMSTAVFAADSPVKSSFNASLKKTSVVYNGKKQQPKVVVTNENGKTIAAKYYKIKVKTCKNAGSYTVTVFGKGKYAGYQEKLTYKIKQKTQKVTLSKSNYTVKVKNVKKKAQSMRLKVSKKAGTVKYTTNNSNIKVKKGKIVVAKGTKAGIYSVKVTVKSKNYKTVHKYIKVTVK